MIRRLATASASLLLRATIALPARGPGPRDDGGAAAILAGFALYAAELGLTIFRR
jgi:hypothetical protein